MDWITGIQKAIDYTEEHLEEGIDFEKVAWQLPSNDAVGLTLTVI